MKNDHEVSRKDAKGKASKRVSRKHAKGAKDQTEKLGVGLPATPILRQRPLGDARERMKKRNPAVSSQFWPEETILE